MKGERTIVVGFALTLTLLFLVCGCTKKKGERRVTGDKEVELGVTEAEKAKVKVAEIGDSRVGVTETEIRIGTWAPLTGPAALWGAVARGTDCYFKMINDEGGIHGRRLKLYIRDDAYQPARTKAAVKELVEKVGVFAFVGGVGTAPGMAVMDYIIEQRVPWVGMATGSSIWANPPKRYLFAVYPNYVDEASILTQYAIDLKKERIGILYQNDDYGKEGLKGVKETLMRQGKQLVSSVSVEVTDTDLSSHIIRLKEANPDVVILWVLPKHGAIAVGTAAKMGFQPQWMTTSTLSDTPLMHDITKGLWEGVIYDGFVGLPDSDNPLMVKYREAWKRYAPQERWGTFFVAGFGFAEVLVEGLKRAGRDLTRGKFIEAMEGIEDFKGIMGRISYGPGRRQGNRSVFLARCKDGKGVKISDWITASR